LVDQTISRLLAHERIRAARHHLERTEEITLARQAALSAVPAPTGAEGRRAARVAELFREVGLQDVLIDEVGNVRGWTAGEPGSGQRDGAGPVVLAAHLDTVFGPDVNVAVERRGRRLKGPGISDNARGLAALVAVAEAVVAARVPAARPILFAATVGEEGSGDLRGVKYLLNGKDVGARHAVPLQQPPVAFIALDGAGLERVVHRALGSKRYHVTYRGPGGHSWAAFGVANPANAVGRAVALLAELVPSVPPSPPPPPPPPPPAPAPRTTCAVVRLGGGTGLNSIPQDAWLDLDLRSEDPTALGALDAAVRTTLERALGDENRRRAAATAPLKLELQLVGDRPSGVTPRAHPLVQAAVAANRALGREAELASASTDANVPIALGVAAIALGAGGVAGDAHLATEWYENTDGALGLVRALLVTAAMAEVV
jgi:tripeptide aminopeptidase